MHNRTWIAYGAWVPASRSEYASPAEAPRPTRPYVLKVEMAVAGWRSFAS
jgi:hypothetical protein